VVAGQGSGSVAVRCEVGPGPYFVGQGFELRVGVVAGAQRPKIDPPRIVGARAWMIDTEVRPITATGIGSKVMRENLFVVRFRVLASRAGALEVPAIAAQVKGRSGRSQPRTVSIQAVPLQGRPAEFLGGVGRFSLEAEASPRAVRVGQELDFRIKVTGPAAWGMTDRPDLGRFMRLPLGLRIEPRNDEPTDEPAARTFVYRLRPTQAGEAVLPPVAIAAYDPAVAHYVTRVTTGVPIRVVAAPTFDATTLHVDPPPAVMGWRVVAAGVVTAVAGLVAAAYFVRMRLRQSLKRRPRFGPNLARRYARQTARHVASMAVENSRGVTPTVVTSAALRIDEFLAGYLRAGTGQALGVLTPDEAHDGVALLTSSQELAVRAANIRAHCDLILYGDPTTEPAVELGKLVDDARRLFEALGRVKRARLRAS
jgi:hypothetical protein